MFISLIIPTYNSEKYIVRCLDSIINQEFLDYEVVIVNDGSSDGTDKLVKEYIVEHPENRFIYKSTDNKGAAEARNIGLSLACGDYVWFIDSDDEIEKDALITIKETIDYSKTDILRFSYRKMEKDKMTRANLVYKEDIYISDSLYRFIYESIKESWEISMACWQYIYKRELIKDIKFIADKEAYGEDILFNCFAYPKASSIQIISDILYKYYVRDDSLSHKKQRVLRKICQQYCLLKQEYLKCGVWDMYKYAVISSYGDYGILGGGSNRYGAFLKECRFYSNYDEAYDDIVSVLSTKEFIELANDALNRTIPEELKELYELLLKKDILSVYKHLIDKRENEFLDNNEKDNNKVIFNADFEIMNIDNEVVAIPIGVSPSYVINLDIETAKVFKYLLETKDADKTLEKLYEDYKDENQEEVKEYFLDFLSQLKAQQVIK